MAYTPGGIAPTSFIIFGATGDLAKKKLIPALFDLFCTGLLPEQFRVVGFSRRELTDEEFRLYLKDVLRENGDRRAIDDLERFLACASYIPGTFEDARAYERLAEFLIAGDKAFGGCSNKLFHLAVPPAAYPMILKNLAASGLTIPCRDARGWTRVLVEKPFGNNFTTAQELDRTLGLLFKEEQIFRIDHYLAKETLQNILAFRFSNILFEPLWSNRFIERVEITLHEAFGIAGRGRSYDNVGALRDVGQNHLLQMLALIAMEDPKELDAVLIRKERARVLEALRPLNVSHASAEVGRGQYKGYRAEAGVAPNSKTETYVRMVAHVENERWRGVPFVLEAGKKMPETKTAITVYFKRTETCLCPLGATHHHQNVLTFRIQPNEGISVVFWAKKPGFVTDLEPQELSFSYKNSLEARALPDAYARVLYDCVRGDQTLFASTAEVEAAWRFVTPILENWHSVPLEKY